VQTRQFRSRPRFERLLAGEQLVEHQTEGVDVAPDRDLFARELFGRHVGGRPGADLPVLDRLRQAGQPEVGDLDPSATVDHHVGRFEIAVQDALFVSGLNAGAELPRDLHRLVSGQTADAAQQRREILAVDVLHREVVLAVGLADVENAADVGVGYLARGANFGEETVQPAFVVFEPRRQKLERDGLAEF